jgi:hypothetical protein
MLEVGKSLYVEADIATYYKPAASAVTTHLAAGLRSEEYSCDQVVFVQSCCSEYIRLQYIIVFTI